MKKTNSTFNLILMPSVLLIMTACGPKSNSIYSGIAPNEDGVIATEIPEDPIDANKEPATPEEMAKCKNTTLLFL